MLEASLTAAGNNPVSLINCKNASSICSFLIPFLQPIPRYPIFGHSLRQGFSVSITPILTRGPSMPLKASFPAVHSSPSADSTYLKSPSAGRSSSMPSPIGQMLSKNILSPLSTAEDTVFIISGFMMPSPCLFAHSSTAKHPFISVAVVITALPPVIPAIFSARALAPPRCPERRGITFSPLSSTAMTAGSQALLLI